MSQRKKLMQKLSGGTELLCGHTQVVSTLRFTIANSGYDQHSVWCVECDGWTTLAPVVVVPNLKQGETLDTEL